MRIWKSKRKETSVERLRRRLPTGATFSILLGLVLIAAVFGGAGGWAAIAKIHGAVIAGGVVTVEQQRRRVQHLEGGVIDEIAVRDGDRVEAGQLLIRLSDARAAATLSIVDVALRKERAQEARLFTEQRGDLEIAFPAELADDVRLDVAEMRDAARQVFTARTRARTGAERILTQRIEQLKREGEGLRAQERAKSGQLNLITEEIVDISQLFEQGQATKSRLRALQRAELQLQGERGELTAAIARTEKAIGETQLEILQRELDFQRGVAEELEATQTRIRDLEQRASAARDVLTRLEIVAPVSGVVVGLAVNTLGAVAPPGQTLLEIVPSEGALYVEVRIRPQDRDDVYVGQNADVRLPAFDQRTTPTLDGELAYVSADALFDAEARAHFYSARVALRPAADSADVRLEPGMPAEVMIRTDERTALDYLTRPILDSINRAWRES